MSRTRVLSAAVLSVGLMAITASAALTPTAVYVNKYNTGAVAAQPALDSTKSFSLRVTQPGSGGVATEFFGSADLQFSTSNPPGGNGGVFNSANGSNVRTFGGNAGDAFDSYVTSPKQIDNSSSNIVALGQGTYPLQHGALTPILLPDAATTRTVDISWGDPQNVNQAGAPQVAASGVNGTFEIARLTLKANTTATLIGRVNSILPGASSVTSANFSTIFISAVLGDGNNDGKTDFQDFGILSANYQAGVTGSPVTTGVAGGDFNEDGKVDFQDFGILSGNYQFGVGPGAVPAEYPILTANGPVLVPEPISLGLVAVSGLFLRRRR